MEVEHKISLSYLLSLYIMSAVATFKVAETEDGAESSSIRQQRRAYLSPDVLRTYKLAAGEWVCLRAPDGEARKVIAQLWPRTGVEDDSESSRDPILTSDIIISDCHRLNLASEQVELYRFDIDSPSRRLIKSAVLEEVPLEQASKRSEEDSSKREKDWVIAAAKETMSEWKPWSS